MRKRIPTDFTDEQSSIAPHSFRLVARFGSAAFLAACMSALVAVPSPSPAVGSGNSVMLLSWDGIRRDVLNELLFWQDGSEIPFECPNRRDVARMPQLCNGNWTCLPNLCQFQIVDSWDPFGPKTLTRPQHAQMLSGYSPEITGITGNTGQVKMAPGITIYERLDQLLGYQIEKAHIADRTVASRGIMKWAKKSGAIPKKRIIKRGVDRKTGKKAAERAGIVLDEIAGNHFFMFVHFKAADWQAHKSGDWSPNYRETIIFNDERLGEILAKLDDLSIRNSTTIYVSTDHGFNGRTHNRHDIASNRETFLASSHNNLQPGLAGITDITPTILEDMGIDATGVDPPFMGASRIQ